MATKARRAGSLAGILNANTSSGSNTVVIDSGGDISLSGSLTVSGTVTGYATNTYLQSTFAQNTYVSGLGNDRLQVANAEALYVTKATALTSNNALINLINDRYQVANADATFLTKSVALTTNTALLGLINDRIQAANVSSTLGLYWPSANVITYTDSAVSGSTKTVNTSIYVASGGENKIAIPYTNTNFLLVYLNGVLLTEDTDYVAANNVHIGGIDPVLSQGDVLVVEEYKNHNANTVNRSAGGGGGGGFSLQGSTYGYKAGGGPASATVIDRFPFASEGTATCVGDLVPSTPPDWYGVRSGASHSSLTDAYMSRYYDGLNTYNRVQKYPFSSESGTIVGCHPTGYKWTVPQNSSTYAYTTGGSIEPPVSPYFSNSVNHINKFPFSAETTTSDVGDLTQARGCGAGASSTTYGYTAGGECYRPGNPSIAFNIIDKYPFASDTNATDVGDLNTAGKAAQGISGPAAGYAVGLMPDANNILKWPFASDTNSTDIGNLVASGATPAYGVGQSCTGTPTQSTTKGYLQSGFDYTPTYSPFVTTIIQAWPFASDTNATCVGDVTVATSQAHGAQV